MFGTAFIYKNMDNKYNVPKPKKPETKLEIIAAQIEELVKQRDRTTDHAAKAKINGEITRLFAQYERAKL